MKTPSIELFNLVKSLSKNEKSSFKLFSKQESGDLNYLKLFDAIDSLKLFDEKKIISVLNQDSGISRIKDVKYNLQKVLIRFLKYYHQDDSVEIQLQSYLQTIEILFGKRLFSLAEKYVARAEKLALAHHRHLALLNLQTWKQKIILGEEDLNVFTKHNEEKYLKELEYIGLYKNEMEFQKIKVQVMGFFNSDTANAKIRAGLRAILKNPFLKNENMAQSFPAKCNYFQSLALVHLMLKNEATSYSYFKLSVNCFEKGKIAPQERLSLYSRFIPILVELKKNSEIIKLKHDADTLMDSIPKKEQTKNLRVLYLTMMNNFIAYQLHIYNLEEASSASDRILLDMEERASPQGLLVYYANRFLINFLSVNYRQALQCINKVLYIEKTGLRPDIVFDMRLLFLVVHYELGNEEILLTKCNSFVRQYKNELSENKMEDLILTFLGKTIHEIHSKEKRKLVFIQLKKDMEFFKNKNKYNLFDFKSWVDSKIENRPMVEVLQRIR